MSLTEDCVSPMAAPISATVIPFRRKSEMREDQVIMKDSIRNTDILCNRHSATEFRDNAQAMPRPPTLPTFDALGPRVRWWRLHRGMTQPQLCKKVGISQSNLSGLENQKQHGSAAINRLAEALGVDAHYLETDEGDPEPRGPGQRLTTPPSGELPSWWPFENVGKAQLTKLSKIELHYAESRLLEALQEITSSRKSKRGGDSA